MPTITSNQPITQTQTTTETHTKTISSSPNYQMVNQENLASYRIIESNTLPEGQYRVVPAVNSEQKDNKVIGIYKTK